VCVCVCVCVCMCTFLSNTENIRQSEYKLKYKLILIQITLIGKKRKKTDYKMVENIT